MSREPDRTSHIPIRGKRKRRNQEGTTLVARLRTTEFVALQVPILPRAVYESFDNHKADVILALYREARKRNYGGMALVNWIAEGRYFRSDVQRYLAHLRRDGKLRD